MALTIKYKPTVFMRFFMECWPRIHGPQVQVQRVALLDEGGQVAGIITQSDIIQIVNANKDKLGAPANV